MIYPMTHWYMVFMRLEVTENAMRESKDFKMQRTDASDASDGGKSAGCVTKKEPYVYVGGKTRRSFSVLVRTHPSVRQSAVTDSHGWLLLALMDLLQKNCMFYYAGDFDPEGFDCTASETALWQETLNCGTIG